MTEKTIKFEHYNLHIINTNKFRSFEICTYFTSKIDPKTVASDSFLTSYLLESTNEYRSNDKLGIHIEELYSPYCWSNINLIGKTYLQSFTGSFINQNYVDDELYLEKCIKFYFDFIFNPNIVDNQFDSSIIEYLKNTKKKNINKRKENSLCYTYDRLVASFDKTNLAFIKLNGNIEDIDNINNDTLLASYNRLLNNTQVDIYLCGNITDEIIELIKKYAKFANPNNLKFDFKYELELANKEKTIEEVANFKQSSILYLYNIVDLSNDSYYAFTLLNYILGVSTTSILFNNVREKKSLCYSIYSNFNKDNNIMLIRTEFSRNHKMDVMNEIEYQLKNLVNSLTEEQLTNAKTFIINDINSSYDEIEDIIFNKYLYDIGAEDNLDNKKDKYLLVTLDDLKSLTNKIKLNTICYIEGD